jgi:hypothetical protein
MKLELVDFELAKELKEVGFKIPTLHHYFEDGVIRENIIEDTYGYYGDEYTVEFEELTNNWNDGFLMKKNGDRCFGCSKAKGYLETFSAPTLELAKMWFREVHGIHININHTCDENIWMYYIENWKRDYENESTFNSYETALSEGLKEACKLIKKS